MKTAISIPDSLFEAAELHAQKAGLSRSALYTLAVERYLRENRYRSITEKLNEVYGETGCEIDPNLQEMQLATIHKEQVV